MKRLKPPYKVVETEIVFMMLASFPFDVAIFFCYRNNYNLEHPKLKIVQTYKINFNLIVSKLKRLSGQPP